MRKSTAFEDQTIVQGMGNRIAKHVLNENFKVEKSTFYVLDASEERALLVKTEFRTGSSIKTKEMATYDKEIDYDREETFFKLKEHVVYGSSRVGIRTHDIDLLGLQTQGFSIRSVHYSIGSRQYELSNHLGNVLSVVSDKVIPYFYGGGIKEMRADIRVAQDYSPFGVTLSKRNFSVSEGYRYGYQGSEKDNEIKGDGNSYTTQFRQLDPRLGRWLSLDPKASSFPWQSPYCSMDNNPISLNDQLGLESKDWVKKPGSKAVEWDGDVNSPGEAIAKHGTGTEYYAPGSVIGNVEINNSGKIGTAYLGENGSGGYLMDEVSASAGQAVKIDDTQSFGFNLSSKVNPSNGYGVSDPLALEKSWMHDAPRFCNMMGYVANGAAMAPGLMMVLPSIYAAAPYVANGTVQVGRFTWSMANVYHKTFGMNGGYMNAIGNAVSQNIANGGQIKKTNILGVITSGFIGSNFSIIGNSLIGGVSSGGLYSISLDGSISDYTDNPTFSSFTIMNGAILGPTLSPFGLKYEIIGTGMYQKLLENTKQKIK